MSSIDDLSEAVTTLEEIERTARRVLGGEHPFVEEIERSLQGSQAAYDACVGRETACFPLVRCPACGHCEAFFKQLQIRSADEPMTNFYRCCAKCCSHRWNEELEIDY